MQQGPGATARIRCDPTDYARKQQEKKERAKELRDQRQRGVFSEDHTFAPKVNPRTQGQTPSSREEDERPGMQQQRRAPPQPTNSFDDIPIRPSKALMAGRKEIISPEETPIQPSKKASSIGNSRPNNNDDDGYGDQGNDSLDNLSRKYPKKAAPRQPEAYSPPAQREPEHDSLHREVKRSTGHDLDDMPIKKLNAATRPTKHTGPCLRNSSCGCPQCGGASGGTGVSSMRPDPPVRRREPKADPADDPYGPQTNTSRSTNSEMESSLTLLKSKMARQKARSAPSNQASLYYERSPPEPAIQSARQQTTTSRDLGYASSPAASSSSIPSRRFAQNTSSQARDTRAPPQAAAVPNPPQRRQPPLQREDDRPAVTTNRRLPRHQEVDESEESAHFPGPISSGFKSGEEPDEYADGTEEMRECGNCNRRFNVISLQKHQKICEKVFTGHRKVYDMSAKRLEGTEAEKLAKKSSSSKKGGGKAANATEQPIKSKAADWKQQSNAFREAMRANREVTQALKEGRAPPPMAPSAPDPSLIPCDYCGRRFNDKAAERHIAFCKEKSMRSGGGPTKKPVGTAAASAAAKAPAARAPPPRKR